MEKVLAEREIVCLKDGERFMMIVPKSEERNVHPGAPPPGTTTRDASAQTPQAARTNRTNEALVLQPGSIDFRRMDVDNVACFYAELVGGKPDREGHIGFGGQPVILQTVTPLTFGEVKYALETLFAWQGFKAVRGADDTIRLERLEQK